MMRVVATETMQVISGDSLSPSRWHRRSLPGMEPPGKPRAGKPPAGRARKAVLMGAALTFQPALFMIAILLDNGPLAGIQLPA